MNCGVQYAVEQGHAHALCPKSPAAPATPALNLSLSSSIKSSSEVSGFGASMGLSPREVDCLASACSVLLDCT